VVFLLTASLEGRRGEVKTNFVTSIIHPNADKQKKVTDL
jgi:hypothetical protein